MAARDSFGAKLLVSDMESSPTFDEVPGVTNIDPPIGVTVSEHDVTAHDSPDHTREWRPGLREESPVTVDFNWNGSDPTHQMIRDYARNRDVVDWEVEDADGNGRAFSGFITDMAIPAPVDGVQEASMTIRPSGAATPITGESS